MTRTAISTAFVLGALVLGAAGCPRTGGGGTGPGTGSGSGTGTGSATPDAGVATLPERQPGNPLLPVDGIACVAPGCVYHAGAVGYFACTNGGAGTCFHYGATCAPSDSCMFDAGDGRYKSCKTIVEGTCSSWGSACAPAGSCMFNAADALHHQCDSVSDGKCTAWGDLCDPG